ncbi:MAG: DUF3465 domain-containing protein [Burkholderiaceae bacterium]|nr:MAG: DUF3465 domain-containing protein [Burkholderiaceae bacterium]
MSKLLSALALIAALYLGWGQLQGNHAVAEGPATADALIARAVSEHASGIRVNGEGVVTRVFSDDKFGSRHQRFILRLASGQTVLVAHNIDLAPRVAGLKAGDTVAFSGIYEWNARGGVVHWTHRDPRGAHAAGWLKHNGETYQ